MGQARISGSSWRADSIRPSTDLHVRALPLSGLHVMYGVYEQRIGHAHRTHVLDLLSRALGEGYLDLPEFERRMALVNAATTMPEVLGQLRDLPPQFQWDPRTPLPHELTIKKADDASRLATLALILGALSIPLALCLVGFLVGIAAVVLGFASKGAHPDRRRQAIAGQILGCVGVLLTVAIIVLANLTESR